VNRTGLGIRGRVWVRTPWLARGGILGAVMVACMVTLSAWAEEHGAHNALYSWGGETLLPFPNDAYTRPDPTSLTGKRVTPPEWLWTPELLSRAPFDAAAVVNRLKAKDGFSPNLPVLFSIPGELAGDALPDLEQSRRADSPIALINLDSLTRLPFRAFTQIREEDGKTFTLVILSPRDRLEHARRYAVVVRDGLLDVTGKPVPPARCVSRVLAGEMCDDGDGSGTAGADAQALRELARAIAPLGYTPSDIALLFGFTVESQKSYIQPLTHLDRFVEQRRNEQRYAVARLHVRKRLLKGEDKARIQAVGEFTALRFVDDRGRQLENPEEQTLKFLLRLPDTCPRGGCPVVIFGHGLSATRGTMFQVSDALASRGIATIATNTIWHNNLVQPMKVVLGTRKNLDLFWAVFVEHIMRNVQLVELIRQDLALRELVPGEAGRAPVRLRADRIFYVGQSLGGLCGVATCFLAPDIKAAVFDVAGGSSVDMMFDSHLMNLLGMPLSRFPGLGDRESKYLMPLAAYLLDAVDPLGFAPFLQEQPMDGEYPRIVSQQAGVGDGLVPNWTTEKLARALGLRLAWDRDAAPDFVTDGFYGGPALRYYHFSDNWFLAHLELFHTGPVVADFFEWSLHWLGTDDVASSSDAY